MLFKDVRAAPTEVHISLETQPEIPLTGTSLKSGPYGSSWLWDKIRNSQITDWNTSTAPTDYGTSLPQLKSQCFKGETLLLVLLLSSELTKTEEEEEEDSGQRRTEKTQEKKRKKEEVGIMPFCPVRFEYSIKYG